MFWSLEARKTDHSVQKSDGGQSVRDGLKSGHMRRTV